MDIKKLNKPHDLFFREMMEQMPLAKSLVRSFLHPMISEMIDYSSFEIDKDIWVDTELSEHRADILYRAKIIGHKGFVYFLLEHKSSIDRKTSLQNLQYMSAIWDIIKNSDQLYPNYLL